MPAVESRMKNNKKYGSLLNSSHTAYYYGPTAYF